MDKKRIISNVKASSIVPSLVVLMLVIGIGMAAFGAFATYIQYVQGASGEKIVKAVDVSREKLQIYIWKNVTKPYNISMVTIINKGSIEATVEYVLAVDYSGNPVKEYSVQITIPPSGRLTKQLSELLRDENYKVYEDVKASIRTFYFKTLRGNIFGSTYISPEILYREEGATVTINGTTLTVLYSSTEAFTHISELTLTTGLTITQVTGRPYWDAEVYVLVVREYGFPAPAPLFTEDEVPIPSWAKPESGERVGVPKVVSAYAKYIQQCDYPYYYMIGRWSIDVEPRPVWVLKDFSSSENPIIIYSYRRYKDCWGGVCTCSSQSYWSGTEKFYPMTSIPKGEYKIKAPQYIKMEYRSDDNKYYMIIYFKLWYYVFYDAFNMTNIILKNNATEATINVDRPLKAAFFYRYSHMDVKPPPPPPPQEVKIYGPPICISQDFEDVGGFRGEIKIINERTVEVKCNGCTAYIAPRYGVLDVSEVTPCPNNVCSNVPIGSAVIVDRTPEK
ncbi:MAG: hypothetical protein QXP12_07990 [Ignisphaera sp.]